jgi:hypothetical protein
MNGVIMDIYNPASSQQALHQEANNLQDMYAAHYAVQHHGHLQHQQHLQLGQSRGKL